MSTRKELPEDKIDKRYVYPIDELRAKYWLSELMKKGYKSPYALSNKFGGLQPKWLNYSKGGQPNDDVLNDVSEKYSESKSWYTSGPEGIKLWPSLAYDSHIETLNIIAAASSKVDGKVAQLRIDALTRSICDDYSNPITVSELFKLRQDEIEVELEAYLEEKFVSDAMSILEEILKPHIVEAYKSCTDELMEFCEGSRYSQNDYTQMHRESVYEDIQLSTIMKKGRREDSM